MKEIEIVGKDFGKLVDNLAKIGVHSKKLALILNRMSQQGLGHSPLRVIDLACNDIGDIGASVLATLLKHSSVVKLYLVNCSIADAGCKAISQAALQNRSLMELFLTNNLIEDEGEFHLTQSS